jgi:hypothetical protein
MAGRTVLSTLAADRCVAFALEAFEAHLSPANVVPKGKLTPTERNILAEHLRRGVAEAFASNYGVEHIA